MDVIGQPEECEYEKEIGTGRKVGQGPLRAV